MPATRKPGISRRMARSRVLTRIKDCIIASILPDRLRAVPGHRPGRSAVLPRRRCLAPMIRKKTPSCRAGSTGSMDRQGFRFTYPQSRVAGCRRRVQGGENGRSGVQVMAGQGRGTKYRWPRYSISSPSRWIVSRWAPSGRRFPAR